MNKSKNDIAWESIFSKYNLLDKIQLDGSVEITASKINEFREARLMTKFDHKSQLPLLFAENNLSILPVSRGSYVIGTFDAFSNLTTQNELEVIKISFPSFLESINYRDITSEAIAINCAFVSKIIHNFVNEENLFPTVSGRMSSESFKFKIDSMKGPFNISVSNSQIEIDGGFEGEHSLCLIEAKNYISNDFIIRQLYYPFKLWENKISKKVRPIFLTYSNGVFELREYEFYDVNHYNSLILVNHRKYIFEESILNYEILYEIIGSTISIKEPDIPFPQADNFNRVINLCEIIKENQTMTKEQYLQDFDFGRIDPRQHDYYTNAARYLGLVERIKDPITHETAYTLSSIGKNVMNLSLMERQKEFIRLIISHYPFKKTLELCLQNGEMPSKAKIVEIMKRSNLYNINSNSTYFRRSSTVFSWTNWIVEQVED
ncbi:MAG: transcriptional regulator [Porphyromonadaceae bacterium]|jgi:hypothetical protein|nr:transcriptional regulator [Porphyromonadaceae bacterium]